MTDEENEVPEEPEVPALIRLESIQTDGPMHSFNILERKLTSQQYDLRLDTYLRVVIVKVKGRGTIGVPLEQIRSFVFASPSKKKTTKKAAKKATQKAS